RRGPAEILWRSARARLDQPELDVVDREAALRLAIEFLQDLGGARRLGSAQRGLLAAARDGDVERSLDLPQILVQCPAEIREALVVDRAEDELQGTGLQGLGRGADLAAQGVSQRGGDGDVDELPDEARRPAEIDRAPVRR